MVVPVSPRRTRLMFFGIVDPKQTHPNVRLGWRKLNEANQVCPHCYRANRIFTGDQYGWDVCDWCGSKIRWAWLAELDAERKRFIQRDYVWVGQPFPPHSLERRFEQKLAEAGI